MNQLAQRSKVSFALKVLNGPEKGAVYRLLSHSVKLGRDDDNDISMAHDPKCSRHHAVISMTSHGVEIRNVSTRNSMEVNGKEVQTAILAPKSVIQLGNTKLQFSLGQELQTKGPAAASGVGGGMKRPKRRKNQSGGPSVFFYVAVACIGLLLYVLLGGDSKNSDEAADFKTDGDAVTQIEQNKKISSDVNIAKKAAGRNSREYRDAQAAYLKGFRDYQKGQYDRAQGNFQTCRAIYPDHPLCGQALTDARTKLSELIQYYLRLGYEHQRKNQFRQCKNAMRNVQIMQKDKSSNIYKEAEAGYKACDARQRERL